MLNENIYENNDDGKLLIRQLRYECLGIHKETNYLFVYSESPAPDILKMIMRHVLDGEYLPVLFRAGIVRPK